MWTYQGSSTVAQITLLNPLPVVSGVSPSDVTSPNSAIIVAGTGFTTGSQILVNGVQIATSYIDASHLSGSVSTAGLSSPIAVQVANPDPGSSVSNTWNVFPSTPNILVTPEVVQSGTNITLTVSASGIEIGSVLSVGGIVLNTVSASTGTVTGSGYMPPWLNGSVPVQVTTADGKTVLAQTSEKIADTAATFDTAARFSTQAGWGPRPDVVMHIQQVGLQRFITEQLAAPVGNYDVTTTNPIRSFFLNITTGNSLLRLRTAWALQTFIPGQTLFSNHNLALPWEQTLERDAFTNYRQILLDAASDPNIGILLNLPGNVASSDPAVHPNQNFARELMQLFSIGTVMLNQDGSPKQDSNDHSIPAYDDDTVINMSRIFTGWNYGSPQNSWFTGLFNIDFSVPLVANETQHDEESKTLFGSVVIPQGQSAAADRDAAIDAIMNHPNTAPFVSRLLIQRLVKSQPSPGYISRVAAVFRSNGQGVKGDLSSVITAILLDPEARAGDMTPDPSDGYLQDPVYQQLYVMSALQLSHIDDQPTYISNEFSEDLWNPGTVFGYFSPNYQVPGTSITSPEFQLLTNFTDIQRSQFMWTVVQGLQPGFANGFDGWLYDNFTTLPSLVDALNHLLYHGAMPVEEQKTILDYCGGITNQHLQMQTAVFLALNGDSYLVSH